MNESINCIRSKKIRHPVGLDTLVQEPEGAETQPIESLKQAETKQHIQEAVASLPEKQREVFEMRYYDELSYEEIAEILNTSIGGLKANYFHAFKKIEAFLKQRLTEEI
jgi:RNA polymerase sigma-70 factor (ECF subfamily)